MAITKPSDWAHASLNTKAAGGLGMQNVPTKSGAIPRLENSLGDLRKARYFLGEVAETLCGAVPAEGTGDAVEGRSAADILDDATREINEIAAAIQEHAMRIRSRLVG